MGAKSKLSVSERREAVMTRRYGISENTLYRWRDEFMTAGHAALANGKGKVDPRSRRIAELRKQLSERDRVIGELTIANRILKKTANESY